MSLPSSLQDRLQKAFALARGLPAIRTINGRGSENIFNETLHVERTTQFDISSADPVVSGLRNSTEIEGGATFDVENGEIALTANSANDSIILDTAQRGNYKSGHQCEAGIGIRLTDSVFGEGDSFKWGYYQGTDGYYFGKDSGGVFVGVRRNTEDIVKLYQKDWNQDSLDGSGTKGNPSGLNLNELDGAIYTIDFVWYGYGPANFSIVIKDEQFNRGMSTILVHDYLPGALGSIRVPNLFVRAELINASGNALKAYVGGRQFSVFGKPEKIFRATSVVREDVSVGTSRTSLFSVKKDSSTSKQSKNVKPGNISILCPENLVIEVFWKATLASGTFTVPAGYDANETVLLANTTSSTITDGTPILDKILHQSGQGNRSQLTRENLVRFDLIADTSITVTARTLTGTATVEAAAINLIEEW